MSITKIAEHETIYPDMPSETFFEGFALDPTSQGHDEVTVMRGRDREGNAITLLVDPVGFKIVDWVAGSYSEIEMMERIGYTIKEEEIVVRKALRTGQHEYELSPSFKGHTYVSVSHHVHPTKGDITCVSLPGGLTILAKTMEKLTDSEALMSLGYVILTEDGAEE